MIENGKTCKKSMRYLSVVMTLFMVLSLLPVHVFADEGGAPKAPEKITISVVEDNTTSIDGKYYGVEGESFTAKAYDEAGVETSVTWSVAEWNKNFCEVDAQTGKLTFTKNSISGGSSMLYLKATSTIDSKISSEISRSIDGWAIGDYNKNKVITLSEDGQKVKIDGIVAGVDGNNVWTHDIKNGIATLESEPGNGKNIRFIAKRPGNFTASFEVKDHPKMKDTANIEIKGLALEDGEGNNGKTYINIGEDTEDAKVQLMAFCQEGRTVASWESSKEAVATVDDKGLVSIKKIGTTLITAIDNEGTKGGIKVVVGSSEKPLFERIELLSNPLTEESYVNESTFDPQKLTYNIVYKTSTASALTFLGDTVYNTEKFKAVAEYKDIKGVDQVVPINSGKMTMLKDIPFDESVLKVTISDKNNENNKTVYTFNITRPRDSQGGILKTKGWWDKGGIELIPVGRGISSSKYKGQTEGTIFKIKDDGTFGDEGIDESVFKYGTFLFGDVEAFNLKLMTKSDYAHMKYSIDNGKTWNEIEQQGTGVTENLQFDVSQNGDKKIDVLIQTIDDATYYENKKSGKDAFADKSTEYTLTVNLLELTNQAKITEFKTDTGEIYETPTSYKISLPFGSEAPIATFKISEGATAKIGEETLVPNGEGAYAYKLEKYAKTIKVVSSDGDLVNEYKLSYSVRSKGAPDRLIDYLCVNSQYTNGWASASPEGTLTGGLASLGNFGGYITYYYDKPLTDNPNNKYGVDLYIFGNANVNTSTSDKKSFFEPGQVWVSEDGDKWYALAGSEHYEKTTIKDYSVTYTKTATGRTAWIDNKGNSNDGTRRCGDYPDASYYPLCKLLKDNSFTLSGILLPASDGTITGTDTSSAGMVRWGYVDALANNKKGEDTNPYLEVHIEDPSKTHQCCGFDLAWAVDENGIPIDTANKEFHYLKVVTASNIWHGAFNEKSTEVTGVALTEAGAKAVGKTEIKKINFTDGVEKKSVAIEKDKNVYSLNVGNMKYVSISLEGMSNGANIYVNNQRIDGNGVAEGIKVTKESGETVVRVLAQEGEKEPTIKIFKLTGTATESDEIIEGLKVNVGGSVRTLQTKDGENYELSVGYKINEISILPIIEKGIEYSVNGSKPSDSYTLNEGKNNFEIVAKKDEKTHKIVLTVTRENAPVVSGENITVYFELLGDSIHGATEEPHTYKKTPEKLEKWIPRTAYEVPKEARVLDVFEKALKEKKFAWVNADGNYISSINGLAEFSNGPNSGWMYTLNGTHPLKGVAEQTLKSGDSIVFHYTDDYTQEEGSEKWNVAGGAMDSEVYTAKRGNKMVTVVKTQVTVLKGNATVTVKDANVAEMVKQAKANNSEEIILDAKVKEANTDKATLELTKKLTEDILKETKADLTITLPETEVKLSRGALKEINAQAKGDKLIVEIEEVKTPTEEQKKLTGENADIFTLTVKCADAVIHSFGNEIVTVRKFIPDRLKEKKVGAVYLTDKNELEVLKGKKTIIDKKDFYEFTTNHFSVFALVDADEAGIEAKEMMGVDEVKNLVKTLKLKAKTKALKKSIKVTVKADKTTINNLRDNGYTVKYKFYRATKKSGKFKVIATKDVNKFTNSKITKGKTYYYKAKIMVYDSEGNLVTKTSFKQCNTAKAKVKAGKMTA